MAPNSLSLDELWGFPIQEMHSYRFQDLKENKKIKVVVLKKGRPWGSVIWCNFETGFYFQILEWIESICIYVPDIFVGNSWDMKRKTSPIFVTQKLHLFPPLLKYCLFWYILIHFFSLRSSRIYLIFCTVVCFFWEKFIFII